MQQARLGHRMKEVIGFVKANPGCTKNAAASALDYHGRISTMYGYAAVNRAIKSGAIFAVRNAHTYSLHAEAG